MFQDVLNAPKLSPALMLQQETILEHQHLMKGGMHVESSQEKIKGSRGLLRQ